jgi:hypothetical protein
MSENKPFWEDTTQTFYPTICPGCTHAPDGELYFCQIVCRGEQPYCKWHMARHYHYSHEIRDEEMEAMLEHSKGPVAYRGSGNAPQNEVM